MMPFMIRAWLWKLLGCVVVAVVSPPALGGASIEVDAGRDVGPVPRRLFGTNVRPNMESGPNIRDFLKRTGITLFRYPDSIDAGYTWDWEAGGVMMRGGKRLLSPLSRFDGMAELARAVNADVCFTVKIHDSSPQEAARAVAEARRRGFGGSHWCFGNEPYFKDAKDYLTREQYVERVNAFAPAMKKADPDIRLGIAWGGPYIEEQADKGRDRFVLRGTRKWVDFIDFHFYTGRWEKEKGIDPKRIMAGSLLVAPRVERFRQIIREEAPDRADQIAIEFWEWNGPAWPEVGGIQTLATALFAADALGEMARCGVAAAIQYNLQEHACGLIPGWEQDEPGSWPTERWNGRTVRPIAYAMELWSRRMGPMLVKSSVTGVGSYATRDWHTLVNYQGDVALLAVHATRGADREALQILVVNRDQRNAIEAEVNLRGFTPARRAEVLTLTGPSASSVNDVTARRPAYHSFADAPAPVVKLGSDHRDIPAAAFQHTFAPHSVTVLLLKAEQPRQER